MIELLACGGGPNAVVKSSTRFNALSLRPTTVRQGSRGLYILSLQEEISLTRGV